MVVNKSFFKIGQRKKRTFPLKWKWFTIKFNRKSGKENGKGKEDMLCLWEKKYFKLCNDVAIYFILIYSTLYYDRKSLP